MQREQLFRILLALVLLTCSTAMAQEQTSEAATDIERTRQHWIDLFNQGNFKGAAQLFTRDAQLLPPNRDFIMVDGIQPFMQGLRDQGIIEIQAEPLEVRQLGDTAYEVGTYSLVTQEGRFCQNWCTTD